MESEDTGTDVSDVESTGSSARPSNTVIKHRTNASLGDHLDLVNRMVSRWGGSMGDGMEDEYKDKSKSPNAEAPEAKAKAKPGGYRRKKSATDEMDELKMEHEAR
eukprot:667703_1